MIWLILFEVVLPDTIMVLFLMVLASNYSIFYTFKVLVYNPSVQSDSTLRSRFKPIEFAITMMYLLCLVIGFIPKLGAYCKQGFIYRK